MTVLSHVVVWSLMPLLFASGAPVAYVCQEIQSHDIRFFANGLAIHYSCRAPRVASTGLHFNISAWLPRSLSSQPQTFYKGQLVQARIMQSRDLDQESLGSGPLSPAVGQHVGLFFRHRHRAKRTVQLFTF